MAKERLYILMRTDMASGTPGKMMAQASHASNAFVKRAFDVGEDISGWTNQTDQGFGTVIVLDGGNINDIRNSIEILYRNPLLKFVQNTVRTRSNAYSIGD